MSRPKMTLTLDQLGQVRRLGNHTWVWQCWLMPCAASTERHDPQLSREAAEKMLTGHLREYHGAEEPRKRDKPRPANRRGLSLGG